MYVEDIGSRLSFRLILLTISSNSDPTSPRSFRRVTSNSTSLIYWMSQSKLSEVVLHHVRADFTLLSTSLVLGSDAYRPRCLIGVKVFKCAEGLHNKAFLLSMDNGIEVFAKLPNPNAGPAHYTTASEVATRKYVSRYDLDCYRLSITKI